MNWKIKALMQNVIALFPKGISDKLYYYIQRNYGDLRKVDPTPHFDAAAEMIKMLRGQGMDIKGKSFLEIGTGRRLNIPLFLWMAGAEKIVTNDLNNLLQKELIGEDINYIFSDNAYIRKYVDSSLLDEKRIELLKEFKNRDWDLDELLSFCGITYIHSTDCATLKGINGKIDYFISNTVFEHIPVGELEKILISGKKYLTEKGLSIHYIDYIDHFWYSDKSISKINFLKFSNKVWNIIAGNKFMYMNRMRHSDYINLIKNTGNSIIEVEIESDNELIKMIAEKKLKINSIFHNRSANDLMCTCSWIVFKPDNKTQNIISN
jgi:hypothetical protein